MGFGVRQLPFYRPVSLYLPHDVMRKTLMERVFFAKETRLHSHEGQETREGTSSFSSTRGLHAGFFTTKDGLLVSKERCRIPEDATSRNTTKSGKSGDPGGLPGHHFAARHLHDDQLASTLTLDELSSSSSSSKERELLLLLSLSTQN